MKTLQLTLSKNITQKEYQWLKRDFEKGDIVILFTGSTLNCIGENGVICSLDGKMPIFELPATALQVSYLDKEFSVFMTEIGSRYSALYCKQAPIAHMNLLTKIQSNHHLVPSIKEKSLSKNSQLDETPILKVIITPKEISQEIIRVQDIAPLF